MMLYLIKFSFYFAISYVILSIPIKEKPLFSYLYKSTSPYTEKILQKGSQTLHESKEIGKKLFNAAPDIDEDLISNQLSSTKKDSILSRSPAIETDDNYSTEDQERLQKIIESAKK